MLACQSVPQASENPDHFDHQVKQLFMTNPTALPAAVEVVIQENTEGGEGNDTVASLVVDINYRGNAAHVSCP
jgi:hypothetical protein